MSQRTWRALIADRFVFSDISFETLLSSIDTVDLSDDSIRIHLSFDIHVHIALLVTWRLFGPPCGRPASADILTQARIGRSSPSLKNHNFQTKFSGYPLHCTGSVTPRAGGGRRAASRGPRVDIYYTMVSYHSCTEPNNIVRGSRALPPGKIESAAEPSRPGRRRAEGAPARRPEETENLSRWNLN